MNAKMKCLLPAACCALIVAALPVMFTGCASTSTRESTGEYSDDSTITAKVKAAYVKDPAVKALQVNVETFKGVVHLSGFVNTQDHKQRAEELAKAVAGVKSVKNDIVVKPGG